MPPKPMSLILVMIEQVEQRNEKHNRPIAIFHVILFGLSQAHGGKSSQNRHVIFGGTGVHANDMTVGVRSPRNELSKAG